jgi:tetratricopeptide (TPR) repeat protein
MPLRSATRSPELMLYLLLALTFACLLALCFVPRALAPVDLPPLVLDRALVAQVIAEDAKQAKSASQTPEAKALTEQFLKLGDIENHTLENAPSAGQQRESLARLYAKLAHDVGEPSALALRAEAVERLEAALRLQLSDKETDRVLGMFPEALARHRATQDGFEVAPHFVLRTLYKTRWNIAMGLAPDYKLERIERQAFHGWIALHATNLGPEPRLMALRNYAAAGGHGIAEARGVLAFLSHDYEGALEAFEQAEKASPSLRIRNWLRGTHVAFDAVHKEESLGRLDSGGVIP